MIFLIIKDLVIKAGIEKTISPHTFVIHLPHTVENGADLRAVQKCWARKALPTTEIYTHLDRNS